MALLSCQEAKREAAPLTIVSPRATDLQVLGIRTATVTLTGDGAFRIESQKGAENADVTFPAGKVYERRDWREFGGIAFDANNLSREDVIVCLSVSDGKNAYRDSNTRLNRGEKTTIAFFFESSVPEMDGAPVELPPGSRIMITSWGTEFDYSNVGAFRLALREMTGPIAIEVSNIRWLPKPDFSGIVDRFGQFTRAEWPGKVHDEAELPKRAAEEAEWLKAHPAPADRDKWGGWKDGPRLEATGFFRTAQHGGKWWLVTPDGTLFFSAGIVGIRPYVEGPVSGREYMFAWLPQPGDPYAKFPFMQQGKAWQKPDVIERRARFYTINLHRKYGPDWLNRWGDVACDRLRCWGFNTIANWSQPELWQLHRVPYVAPISYGGMKTIGPGARPIPDFFDESLPKALDAAVAKTADVRRDDPWCIGYFVDNELQWESWKHMGLAGDYALPRFILTSPPDQPAKREFIGRLRAKYATIEALNKAWNATCASWDALLAEPLTVAPAKLSVAARTDCSEFLTHYARRYFTVVRDAMKRHAPRQLYLGCRFSVRPMEVVKVAAEFCDVVSFNIYRPRLEEADWAFTDTLGKPIVIGEFGFGATDRGMFHYGACPVRSQADRGRAYEEYVRSVLRHPAFVGCHWFEYVDEALTGRFDGENYNVGMVSVTDTPYPELRDAARAVNGEIYRLRGATSGK